MTPETIAIALIWGAICGYLALRLIDSLLGIGFCVHGLFAGRWRQLAKKAGRVKPVVILRLMLRLAVLALLFGYLLHIGYQYTRYPLLFDYRSSGAILWAVVALAVLLSRLPALRWRLLVYWKITHEYDYAERLRRTFLLRH